MRRERAAPMHDRRAAFGARGWIVVREVVSARDLEALNGIFDELMPSAAESVPAGGRRVELRPNACRTHPALLRHLHDGIAALTAELLGATSIRLLQDALLLKPPGPAGTIALHQDYTYMAFLDSPSIVSVGLALTDASADSGCLTVVDGSHTWGLVGTPRIFAETLHQDIDALLTPAQREAVERDRVALEVQAGDVTIHHSLTLHGSGDNRQSGPRKTIVTHLFNGACRLVRDRVPPPLRDRFTTDASGHLTGPAFPLLGLAHGSAATQPARVARS